MGDLLSICFQAHPNTLSPPNPRGLDRYTRIFNPPTSFQPTTREFRCYTLAGLSQGVPSLKINSYL